MSTQLPAQPDYDIAILGTGPVGYALALALAHAAPDPGRIALMGPPPPAGATDQSIDPRAIALNHGSRQWLEHLDAWPQKSADIMTVHVSQAGHAGRTMIDHGELDVPRLGSVVTYDSLLACLHGAAATSGVSHLHTRPPRPPVSEPLLLQLDNGSVSARLVLLSDGARPAGLHREYGQHAVLASIQAAKPVAGRAYERFTRTGPLALLPHPAGKGLYSLVWCVSPARAQSLLALSPAGFSQALQQAFGKRLGELHLYDQPHCFPLALHAGPCIQGKGMLAVGNAAQTLHPVAGQGLNLGLRDVAQLTNTLRPWLARPHEPLQPLLEQYACMRRPDRYLTLAITDTLPRIFATENPLIRHACGMGLAALDLFPALRNPLARHLLQGQRI